LDWCAENDVSVVAVDQSGELRWTLVPGKGGEWQAELRRSQALAPFTESGMEIAQWIVRRRIVGQREVLRDLTGRLSQSSREVWPHSTVPGALVDLESILLRVEKAATIPALRQLEAEAAVAYWSAWIGLPLHFAPPSHMNRVPA